MALTTWAVPRLSKLLPLDEDSLKQVIEYSDTLSKDAAAEHLKNLLGDSPQALEFIASFNSRRQTPQITTTPAEPSSSRREDLSEVPRSSRPRKKRGSTFNKLPPPRRPDDYGNTAGAYVKKEEASYISGISKARAGLHNTNALGIFDSPEAHQLSLAASDPPSTSSSQPVSRTASPKLPPSAAGRLISDHKSRESSPSKAKTKVSITGGTPMHGQSETLNDLDSAIRALEIQTNPSLAPSTEDNARRRCNCMAQRHPLLAAAPNCLNCGKIICVKEGLGPCTFCNRPLLSSSDLHTMVRLLRDERGKERTQAHNAAHKRADISASPRPFAAASSSNKNTSHLAATPLSSSAPSSDSEAEALAAAKQHRDKLLAFQAQNARRTRVHDEAADFETPDAGTSLWASPAERALQLKRQQRVLREHEWAARPEHEKRQVVASIDLVGGRVVRRMAKVDRPRTPESSEEEGQRADGAAEEEARESGRPGAFSRNPLLGGGLIRPVARVEEDAGKGKARAVERPSTWRRVQDDEGDNEKWILDGGLYGGNTEGRILGAEERGSEEPSCG